MNPLACIYTFLKEETDYLLNYQYIQIYCVCNLIFNNFHNFICQQMFIICYLHLLQKHILHFIYICNCLKDFFLNNRFVYKCVHEQLHHLKKFTQHLLRETICICNYRIRRFIRGQILNEAYILWKYYNFHDISIFNRFNSQEVDMQTVYKLFHNSHSENFPVRVRRIIVFALGEGGSQAYLRKFIHLNTHEIK